MKRRIFIAVKVSSQIEDQIIEFQKKHKAIPVRWVKRKNLHITLIPPWHESNWEEIASILKLVPKEFSKFKIEFTDINIGPTIQNPFLIWAKINPSKQLEKLKNQIESRLSKNNIPLNDSNRVFQPHVTACWFNPRDLLDIEKDQPIEDINWTETIDSFAIMDSKKVNNHRDYEILANFQFKN